jgi:uncharacterized protein (DUF302 family)
MTDYGYGVEVKEGYDEAVLRARLALRAEGFSIITEMHVGGMLGPEAGSERQYLIMGAWAAPASQRPLDATLEVAVHLSCNVVVQETGSTALVAALDPAEALERDDGEPAAAADAAREALGRVLQRVTSPP